MCRPVAVELYDNHQKNEVQTFCYVCGILGSLDMGFDPMGKAEIEEKRKKARSLCTDNEHKVVVRVYRRLLTGQEIRSAIRPQYFV